MPIVLPTNYTPAEDITLWMLDENDAQIEAEEIDAVIIDLLNEE